MTLDGYLNHPFKIEHLTVTPSTTDQTTGEWVPETTVATVITGNFFAEKLIGERWGQQTKLEDGEAILFTSTTIKQGDKVIIHHDNTDTNFTIYRVTEVSHSYPLLSQHVPSLARNEYKLVREDNA